MIRKHGRAMRYSNPNRARRCAVSPISVSSTLFAPAMPSLTATRSGIIKRVRGLRTMACASITSSCHRKPQIG